MTNRKVGDVIFQGTDEEIAYSMTTTNWGSDPTDVVVKAYDISSASRVDVTATVLSGSASVTGDVITLPKLKALTAGTPYRIEVKFTSGGNIYEPYVVVIGEY